MRDPQGGFPGLREARLGLAMARGGRRGGASPERARAASMVRYRLKQLAQKQNKTRLVLTEGWNWGKDRRRVLTAKSGGGAPGCTRTGRCGDSPGPWIPWIVTWSPCRGATGVRRHGANPEAWNCGGGLAHLRRRPVQIRWLHGPGSRVQDWGSFLVPRQSYGGVCPGLGHGGAAWPRRRTALCAAELCGRDDKGLGLAG